MLQYVAWILSIFITGVGVGEYQTILAMRIQAYDLSAKMWMPMFAHSIPVELKEDIRKVNQPCIYRPKIPRDIYMELAHASDKGVLTMDKRAQIIKFLKSLWSMPDIL